MSVYDLQDSGKIKEELENLDLKGKANNLKDRILTKHNEFNVDNIGLLRVGNYLFINTSSGFKLFQVVKITPAGRLSLKNEATGQTRNYTLKNLDSMKGGIYLVNDSEVREYNSLVKEYIKRMGQLVE